MPIEKYKVEHKFGIISHSQRILLENRLENKSKTSVPPGTYSRRRRHYEITENFIAKFNDSSLDGQENLLPFATKMLARVKRRVGLREGGEGDHVSLPKAWAELSLLAQLNNKELQEESLEVLITSLNQAPLLQSHIPSLFFLAMTALHWLRKIGVNQPCLRTGELKLIKMGHVVFVRLYYFYLNNSLTQGYMKEKQALLIYLAGLSEQQYVYRSFPGSLLALRFMNEVGYLICKGVPVPQEQCATSPTTIEPSRSFPGGSNSGEIPHVNSKASKESFIGYPYMEKIAEEEQHSHSPTAMRTHTSVESIHDVSATLWHILDVWRCTMHKGIGLKQALDGLSVCGTGMAAESWLDVSCAFSILAHTCSTNLSALQTFQSLAAGAFPRPAALAEIHARHLNLCEHCHSGFIGDPSAHALHQEEEIINDGLPAGSDYLSVGQTPSFVRGLREFANLSHIEKNERKQPPESIETESLRSRDEKHESSSEASFADVSSIESEGQTRRKGGKMPRRASSKQFRSSYKSFQFENGSSSSEEEETRKPKEKVTKRNSSKERLGTGVRFQTEEPGTSDTEVKPHSGTPKPGEPLERELTKGSLYSGQTAGSTVTIPLVDDDKSEGPSITKTGTSLMNDMIGAYGWPWELVYLYTEAMTSVCLHGNSSLVQKVALLGSEAYKKPKVLGKKGTVQASGLGLADMLKFKLPETKVSANKDWSWRIRFAAVQGLVRVSRHSYGDSIKDGMCSTAWNLLMRHHSTEKDMRVLEALKLAQVEVEMDKGSRAYPSMLISHIAAGLASTMLPQLPPIIDLPEMTLRPKSRVAKVTGSPPKRAPTRPSLRQEILLATASYEPPEGYGARMNKELMTVIKDQWRKQLHIDEEEEEAEKRKREGEKILREEMDGKADGKMDGKKDGTQSSIKEENLDGVDDGCGMLSSVSGRLSIKE
ncbi:transmembrane protein 232-like [Actinia tenebrosa]|uniref:Transmembrane protein 232-like n=1 Tax=Actinia tenebrosa TaxID=6105 RepID=A0A6P8IWR7_ACTTE|nr:transmembrane protein 232-like [Actinia tenebrosa]